MIQWTNVNLTVGRLYVIWTRFVRSWFHLLLQLPVGRHSDCLYFELWKEFNARYRGSLFLRSVASAQGITSGLVQFIFNLCFLQVTINERILKMVTQFDLLPRLVGEGDLCFFWDFTQRRMGVFFADVSGQRIGSHHQGSRTAFFLNMGLIHCPETSARN